MPFIKEREGFNLKKVENLWYEIGWLLASFMLGPRPLHALDVRMRANIQKGDKVLELGAGYPLYKIYSGKVGETGAFFALDINKRIAERSKKISQSLNASKKTSPENIIIADTRYLPFAENSIDIILESNVILNIPPKDVKRAYREAIRVLKPGGKFLSAFMVPAPGWKKQSISILKDIGFINIKSSAGTPFVLVPLFWNRFLAAQKPISVNITEP